MNKLLSQQDVINYLQVTRQTIYTWRREGKFPKPFQVGRFLRWKMEDIETFASQHLAHI